MTKVKAVHATESNETYCGLFISDQIKSLDTRTTGNINKVTCKRCLKVAFKR